MEIRKYLGKIFLPVDSRMLNSKEMEDFKIISEIIREKLFRKNFQN